MAFVIDIEPTNRCNAKCHFCPRDMTPHQGLMEPQVFARALDRAVEFKAAVGERGLDDNGIDVSLCGLGEPLLNRHTPDFVHQVREAGFPCLMSSNGSLLDERRSQALMDAGLNRIYINVGERDDDYEDIYKLPWEKTRDNVLRFKEIAADECEIWIVLVDHRRDSGHQRAMKEYWGAFGFTIFSEFEIMNRGGALFVDHMQFEGYSEITKAKEMLAATGADPICAAPFVYLFVGWDGQYYLCCSDWTKKVPLGSVFDTSFLAVTEQKMMHVTCREPICKTCNHDPVNLITEELRAINAGDSTPENLDAVMDSILQKTTTIRGVLDQLAPGIDGTKPLPARRLIPVTAT